MVLSVVEGELCSVVPGALLSLTRGHRGFEALPLRAPEGRTSIGFMVAPGARPSRALEAALALARETDWIGQATLQGGV